MQNFSRPALYRPALARLGLASALSLGLALACAPAALGAEAKPAPPPRPPNVGLSKHVWHVSNSPKLKVDVAAGCPAKVSGYRDVVNTFVGPPLVPANPTGGLVCRYVPGLASKDAGRLARSTKLNQSHAAALAGLIRKLSVKPPTGPVNCPADFDSVAVIAFSYSGRADVALWYNASGCQSLDNGAIGSSETGDPSFYNGFMPYLNKLSPPVQG